MRCQAWVLWDPGVGTVALSPRNKWASQLWVRTGRKDSAPEPQNRMHQPARQIAQERNPTHTPQGCEGGLSPLPLFL